ncbi:MULTISPECIES: type III-B CRISPR module RAMP protein Cmr6 [unclassified Nocardiopsis]|uniref:type III-B CRISPR module RAMP protein Cmr6 n=1 Tax=Nocardiopsis TaxID=2013 RepID=UPI00387AEFCD
MPVPSAGPLGGLIQAEWGTDANPHPALVGTGASGSANALTVLRRTAFVPDGPAGVELPKQAGQALVRWAQDHALGQVGEDLSAVAKRRERALAQLRSQGKHVARVLLRPQWRLVVGLGEKGNAHELGITLHGTYGWPIIPGSGLKGVTAAYVWDRAAKTAGGREIFRMVFGAPLPPSRRVSDREPGGGGTAPEGRAGSEAEGRDHDKAARGAVRFLDALAVDGPLTVSADVLTPHVKPYYDTTRVRREGEEPEPPAEYHQPVPVQFLTITGGTFAADLVGDTEKITGFAAARLREAVEDLGVGAKTAAGYGYMNAHRGGI